MATTENSSSLPNLSDPIYMPRKSYYTRREQFIYIKEKLPELTEFCEQEIAEIDRLNAHRVDLYKRKRMEKDVYLWQILDLVPNDYNITIDEVVELWKDTHEETPLTRQEIVNKLSFLTRNNYISKAYMRDGDRTVIGYIKKGDETT